MRTGKLKICQEAGFEKSGPFYRSIMQGLDDYQGCCRYRAIDLWLLFPLGSSRLITKSGTIRDTWRKKLDTIFGSEDWYDKFYRKIQEPDLFTEVHDA